MIRLLIVLLASAAGLLGGTPMQRELFRVELPPGWKQYPLRNRLTVLGESDSPRLRSDLISLGGKHAGCLISALEISAENYDPHVFLREANISSPTLVHEAPFSEWAGRQGHGVERLIRHDYGGTVIFTASRKFTFHENGIAIYLTAQSSDKDRRKAERGLRRGGSDFRAILRSLRVGASSEQQTPDPARVD